MLTDEAIEAAITQYRDVGYARLTGVAGPETLAQLRARADEIATGVVAYPGMFFQPDTPTGRYDDLQFGQGWTGPDTTYRKIEKLELDPVFRAWIENQAFHRIVRRVIEGAVTIYRAVLFNKAARTGSDLPWHQDGGRFWGLDRDPELQLWTALDDAPMAAGGLEMLAGSHRAGLATPLGGVVPKANVDAFTADRSPVPMPCKAGDVLLVHNHVWHRSGRNTSDAPRRGFSVCYMSASARCTRKKRTPREFVRVFEA